MNNHVKIKAKQFLYKNTLRLFFISLLSLIFRFGAVALIILAPSVFINTGLFNILCDYIGVTAGVVISGVLYILLAFGLLCFASGVGMGEKWIYLQRLSGVKPRLRFLFKYLSPKKSIRAFNLYAKTFLLKILWLLYFMMPPCLVLRVCSLSYITRSRYYNYFYHVPCRVGFTFRITCAVGKCIFPIFTGRLLYVHPQIRYGKGCVEFQYYRHRRTSE